MTDREDRPQQDPELTSQERRGAAADRAEEKPPRKGKRRRRLAYTFSLLGMIGVLGASALYLVVSRGGGDEPSPDVTQIYPPDIIRVIDETFETPSEYWELDVDQDTGDLSFGDGYFLFEVRQPDTWLVSRNTLLNSPGSVSVVVEPLTTLARDSAYGVMCHVQEDGDGYAFAVMPRGQFKILKIVHGYEITLAEGEYSYDPFETPEILFGCLDGSLAFRIDTKDTIRVEDTTYTEGAFAFFAKSGNQDDLIIGFDAYSINRFYPQIDSQETN